MWRVRNCSALPCFGLFQKQLAFWAYKEKVVNFCNQIRIGITRAYQRAISISHILKKPADQVILHNASIDTLLSCPVMRSSYAFLSSFTGGRLPLTRIQLRCSVDRRPQHSYVRCSLHPYLKRLSGRQDLSSSDARDAVEYIISGDAHDAEIGAFLALLASKGETAEEVTGVVEALQTRMVPVESERDVLDIVGTGGDGFNTVNISTAASILAAAAGCAVAKHGNRSVSSKSGSADVLEALGITLSADPEVVSRCIRDAGIGFMFAPYHHPAMKYVGPSRKALKLRTVFNIIGPLLNPCSAKYAVIGVYEPRLLDTMADVLISNGVKKAVVVHTAGLDEFSNTGVSEVIEIDGKSKKRTSFDPLVELGIPRADVGDLKGGDADHNAEIIRKVLSGDLEGPITDAILLNAAVGCYVYGLSSSIKDGLEKVRKCIDSGDGSRTLEEWARLSSK